MDAVATTAVPRHCPVSLDDALIAQLQRDAFDYFLQQVEPLSGLVTDTSRPGSPVSIAVVGFALSCYPIAVERGWMTRESACALSVAAMRFFSDSDQSGAADATGYRGFYFHFLDPASGKRVWNSELSMVDTALLIAGVLMAAEYFDRSNATETQLRTLADALYRRIDWRWAQDGGHTIMQGWKPECGFLHYGWEGYNEAIVLYVLALGSPTFPILPECYKAWTSTYQWENIYGVDVLYAGPLFVHQFSHAWIDFRGLQDGYMREKGSDYFQNSCRAISIQREYALINPGSHAGYGVDGWGLSAGDGPSDEVMSIYSEPRRLFGYAARGVPYGPDDGTLSPPAVLACLPFAPETTLRCMHNLLQRYPEIRTFGRLTSGFNADLSIQGPAWVSSGHFGLDQGIVTMMIENHRTGLPWRLMRGCRYLVDGLRFAGFQGGWL
jgi:hypothetical protein